MPRRTRRVNTVADVKTYQEFLALMKDGGKITAIRAEQGTAPFGSPGRLCSKTWYVLLGPDDTILRAWVVSVYYNRPTLAREIKPAPWMERNLKARRESMFIPSKKF